MSLKELERSAVIEKELEENLKQKEASRLLGLSDRQVRRISKRETEEGVEGIVHRNRGRPSNRRYGEAKRKKVLKMYRELFNDFGPTFAREKLQEICKEVWYTDERLSGSTFYLSDTKRANLRGAVKELEA